LALKLTYANPTDSDFTNFDTKTNLGKPIDRDFAVFGTKANLCKPIDRHFAIFGTETELDHLLLCTNIKYSVTNYMALSPFLTSRQLCSYSRIYQHFMELEDSLLCSLYNSPK
jgi:hypothetical protein